MTIQILKDTYNKADFNDKAHHPLQTWEWGEARKQLGTDVVRIADSNNVFQMTIHPIPYSKYKIGYLPRSVVPSSEVRAFMADYGRKNGLIFIKIEPYVRKSEEAIDDSQLTLIRSPHALFPDWTQMLDITPSEEVLLKAMKPKTRYNIKLAQKKEVVVKEESTDKGFEVFSKLYFDTTKRQQYFGHTPRYHKTIWDHMKHGISHIVTAYFENDPLASYELFMFKDTLYYPYGGSSSLHRNLMGTNLLMWESILLGKRLGAQKFDMWGSLPPGYDEHDPWSGFTKFKEGYGCEFVEFVGSYDLVINQNLYNVYNTVHHLRSVFLKIKRMFM